MVFYIEACESGSMMTDLPADINGTSAVISTLSVKAGTNKPGHGFLYLHESLHLAHDFISHDTIGVVKRLISFLEKSEVNFMVKRE